MMMEQAAWFVLDFSEVAQFDETTLALLTVNLVVLTRKGSKIRLHGLSAQQLCALRHFGIELSADDEVRVSAL